MELNDIANDLLKRTYEYCVDFPSTQIESIREVIKSTLFKLAKAKDSRSIESLTNSLKQLYDIHDSLHMKSVIAFQASYRPLVNLVESEKLIPDVHGLSDGFDGDVNVTVDENEEVDLVNTSEIDFHKLYNRYVD